MKTMSNHIIAIQFMVDYVLKHNERHCELSYLYVFITVRLLLGLGKGTKQNRIESLHHSHNHQEWPFLYCDSTSGRGC